jgi:diguanylate cyclase (GGDEF)-like protein/PAS domain S-box-containing protein
METAVRHPKKRKPKEIPEPSTPAAPGDSRALAPIPTLGAFFEDPEFSAAFVNLSSDGIWRLDFDHPIDVSASREEQYQQIVTQSYFAGCNTAFAKICGLQSSADLVGRRMLDLLDFSEPWVVELLRKVILANYRVSDFEISRFVQTAKQEWYLANIFGLQQDGLINRAWGTLHDISDLKRNERIQATLYKISQATNSTHNLHELYESIHNILGDLMSAVNFFIAIYDKDADLLSFPYFVDEHDETPSPRHPQRGLTEYVLRTGISLLADPDDFDKLVLAGEVETVGTPSIDWMGVPLIIHNDIIGVLSVQTYTEGVRYSDADRDVLMFVSNQVAMAIDRKRAEETLRMNEARYRAIVEDQTELICRFLPDTTLTFVNEAYCRYYNKKRDELIGISFTSFVPPEDRPSLIGQIAALTQTNPSVTIEHRGLKPGSIITWEQWSTRAIFDDTGQIVEFQSVGRDITDRKKFEDELRYLSTHDKLTGIYNRAYFEDELTRMQNGRTFPVSVLMADVDGLKETNDTHGHPAGDELLRQTANVLQTAFRSQDVVARIGGDEFGIILPGADSETAQHSIERIRMNLEEHNSTPGNILISLSLGFATASSGDELLEANKQADTMMYQEKFHMRAKRVQEILRGMRTDF